MSRSRAPLARLRRPRSDRAASFSAHGGPSGEADSRADEELERDALTAPAGVSYDSVFEGVETKGFSRWTRKPSFCGKTCWTWWSMAGPTRSRARTATIGH